MERDETTGMLQQLQMTGIGYATAAQVENQQTVRIVPINNLNPSQPAYPYQRTLFYVYKNPSNPAVTAFLGFLNSPEAQTAIQSAL
jgi:phosphate transport system substrate-binding protein